MRSLAVRRCAVVVCLAALVEGCGASAAPSPSPQVTERPSPSATPVIASPSPPAVTDAGTVTIRTLPAEPVLDSIAVADAAHGWTGGAGTILATNDAGRTWRTAWSGTETVVELATLDRLHVWALAGPAVADGPPTPDTLLRSADGGQSWGATRLAVPLRKLDVVSPTEAWAIEPKASGAYAGVYAPPLGVLRHTSDGGRTWTSVSADPVSAICFANPQEGWAVGMRVLRTRDGGRTWQSVATTPYAGTATDSPLSCAGSALWLFEIVGEGAGGHVDYAASRSTDGGQSWRQVLGNSWFPWTPAGIPQADAEPGPFTAPDALTAAELGASPAANEVSVTVTHEGGRTWQRVEIAGLGLDLSALVFPDREHGYLLAGWYGRSVLLATDDGGRSWHERWPTTAPHPVGAMQFASATLGYGTVVPGDGRAVQRTTDGGRTWVQIAELPEPVDNLRGDPERLSFADPLHGWAVTLAGHLLATTDGAVSWRTVALPAGTRQVTQAVLASAGHGCVFASDAAGSVVLLSTNDDGRTWQTLDPTEWIDVCAAGPTGPTLARAASAVGTVLRPAITILSPKDGVALLDDGSAATTDGGATWTKREWPSTTDAAGQMSFPGAFALSFVSPTTGWMQANDGAIYATTDAGASWTELP